MYESNIIGETKITIPISILRKRLFASLIAITFIFLLLISRLFIVQVIMGETLQARAVDQWTRELPVKAVRGNIVDANGEILAGNDAAYAVYVRPRCVTATSFS